MSINRRDMGIAAAVIGSAMLASSQGAVAQSADETAVKGLVAAYYKAYIDADGTKLNELISDQLSFGHSDGRVEDKTKVVADIVAKKNIYKNFTFSNETMSMVDNMVIVRHRVVIEAESGGKMNSVGVRILQVWAKQGGAWKLVARQAVPSPNA